MAHDYFQLVLNDVCVFEVTVAQAQASYVAQQGIRQPTKEVLHHHGKALLHLRDKLADPVKRNEDATIHAILGIMGTHVRNPCFRQWLILTAQFFFGQLDEHQAHLDGLWNIINSMNQRLLGVCADHGSARWNRYVRLERDFEAGG